METSRSLRGLRVLVVEDDFMIVDLLVEELEAHGLLVVGPVATVRQGLDLIRDEPKIDAAILDMNVGGEMAYPIVEKLRGNHVPVILATGYDPTALPEGCRDLPMCGKPYKVSDILAVLSH